MRPVIALILLCLSSTVLLAQDNIMLMPFESLMNATWKAEGRWNDGTPFKQEVIYKWSDNGQTVQMETKSYLDSLFTDFGKFSEGVHQWDTVSNTIQFRIEDVHGKITEGTVKTQQKTILYEYVYEDERGVKTYMTDALIWVKPDKYMYKVGTREGDQWKKVYLETYFFKK